MSGRRRWCGALPLTSAFIRNRRRAYSVASERATRHHAQDLPQDGPLGRTAVDQVAEEDNPTPACMFGIRGRVVDLLGKLKTAS